MVFHWNLSDSISLLVSRTKLSILADLNNAGIWMVSARLPISNISSPLYQAFGDFSKWPSYHWYHRHLHVPQHFLFSGNVQVLFTLFIFFYFHSVVGQDNKNPLVSGFSFFISISTRSVLLARIRFSVCISKPHRILGLSLQDRFWFLYIWFGSTVKFYFFAQFPTDLLSPFCLLFLC